MESTAGEIPASLAATDIAAQRLLLFHSHRRSNKRLGDVYVQRTSEARLLERESRTRREPQARTHLRREAIRGPIAGFDVARWDPEAARGETACCRRLVAP